MKPTAPNRTGTSPEPRPAHEDLIAKRVPRHPILARVARRLAGKDASSCFAAHSSHSSFHSALVTRGSDTTTE